MLSYGISSVCRWLFGCTLSLSLALAVVHAQCGIEVQMYGENGGSFKFTATKPSGSAKVSWKTDALNGIANYQYPTDYWVNWNWSLDRKSGTSWVGVASSNTGGTGTNHWHDPSWTKTGVSSANHPDGEYRLIVTYRHPQNGSYYQITSSTPAITNTGSPPGVYGLTLPNTAQQVVDIEPNFATLIPGETLTLTAEKVVGFSDAEVTWTVTGPGTLINQQTAMINGIATAQLQATGVAGQINVSVVMQGRDCATTSDPAVAIIEALEEEKFCISWTIYNGPTGASATVVNPAVTDQYRMIQDGQVIATKSVPWGALVQFKKDELETDSPVTLEVERTQTKYAWDETRKIWIKNPLEISWWALVETATPTTDCNDRGNTGDQGGSVPPVVNPVDPQNPGQPPNNLPNDPTDDDGNDTTGTIWRNITDDSLLDKDTYAEGVSKLEKQLQEISDKLDNGTSVSDPNAQAIADAAQDGQGATDGEGNGNGGGQASSSTSSAFSAGHGTPSFSLPSGSSSGLTATIGGYTFSADPASDPHVMGLITFLKEAMVWAFSIAFAWFCWIEFGKVIQQVLQADQAKGNAVIGGTGAQATALIAAAAITALIIAVPAAYWAFATYTINPIGSVTGPASFALYYLFLIFPVSAILGFITAAFVIKKAGIVLVAATATLIRFVVP